MREIKFRCYSKDLGIMVYDNDDSGYQFDVSSGGVAYIYEGYREVWDFETILMQYTGLKDKNGKEIYEGDLLYHKIQGLRKVYYPFDETSASFGLLEVNKKMRSYLENSFLYEVVGNIYKNPELLKGE